MATETVHPLDPETLELFAVKGTQGGPGTPQVGNANGVKVRRVMQIASDLTKMPFEQLRILDLACGEGVYAIEAALRGAKVRAVDARTQRMDEGARAARRLGLSNLEFEQNDIRKVNNQSHGQFDVIFFLGILYHLDAQDVFPVLQNIYEMCGQFVVIDTHISLQKLDEVEHDRHVYKGTKVREHSDADPQAVRKSRLLSSLDNTWSFWFTTESLIRLLNDTGFSSVYICDVPLEPLKPQDRITLVAIKGMPVRISSYPWVNDKTESEIEAFLRTSEKPAREPNRTSAIGLKQRAKSTINRMFRSFGFEITRID
jgi:SAM-dependent methyltransferase